MIFVSKPKNKKNINFSLWIPSEPLASLLSPFARLDCSNSEHKVVDSKTKWAIPVQITAAAQPMRCLPPKQSPMTTKRTNPFTSSESIMHMIHALSRRKKRARKLARQFYSSAIVRHSNRNIFYAQKRKMLNAKRCTKAAENVFRCDTIECLFIALRIRTV